MSFLLYSPPSSPDTRIVSYSIPTSTNSRKGRTFRRVQILKSEYSSRPVFKSYERHTFRSFHTSPDKSGEPLATYAIYDLSEAHTWEIARPQVDGTWELIHNLIEEYLRSQTPLTDLNRKDFVEFFNDKYLCYGGSAQAVDRYDGYWAFLTGVTTESPVNSGIPHFDVLLRDRLVSYPSDADIPIGYLCIPPYHLARKPLYLERCNAPRVAARVRKLHYKVQPPVDIFAAADVEPTSNAAAQSTPAVSPDPLPFPAPVAEDGYPSDSD